MDRSGDPSRLRRAAGAALILGSLAARSVEGTDAPRRTAPAPEGLTAITTSNPYCYQPDPRQNVCFVGFRILGNVGATNPDTLKSLTLTLDGKLVHRSLAFFEAGITATSSLHGPGFRVPCGLPGVSGDPDPQIGKVYSATIQATTVSSNTSTNSMPIGCPAYLVAEGASVISIAPTPLTSQQPPDRVVLLPLTISDLATFDLAWAASVTGPACTGAGVKWASLAPVAGKAPGNGSSTAIVAFDSTGLAPATYQGHLCVASGDTFTPNVDVPLTMTVTPASPGFSVSPASVGLELPPGQSAKTTLEVSDTGAAGVLWTIAPSLSPTCAPGTVPWLTLSTTSGMTAPGATTPVDLTFDATGLSVGSHPAYLCASSDDPANPSIVVPLRLDVVASNLFYPLTPCRLFDTRNASGPDAASPILAPGEIRTFSVAGRCSVPGAARSLSVNVTVTGQTAAGGLLLFRADLAGPPTSSTISFRPGVTRANNAIIELARDGTGKFRVVNRSTSSVHLIVDVNGTFH